MTEKRFVEVEREVDVLPPEGAPENHLALKCSGEPNFLDTHVRMCIGAAIGDPDYVFPDKFWPQGLHHYNIPTRYKPEPGETSRTFWLVICTAEERIISEPLPFLFNTHEGRRYMVRLKWQESAPPEPPKPPIEPPTELVEVLVEIRDELRRIASSRLLNL